MKDISSSIKIESSFTNKSTKDTNKSKEGISNFTKEERKNSRVNLQKYFEEELNMRNDSIF